MSSSPDRPRSLRTRFARPCQACEQELGPSESGPYCTSCGDFLFEGGSDQPDDTRRKRRKTSDKPVDLPVVTQDSRRASKAGRKRRILIEPEDIESFQPNTSEDADFEDEESGVTTDSAVEGTDDDDPTRRRRSARGKEKERVGSPRPRRRLLPELPEEVEVVAASAEEGAKRRKSSKSSKRKSGKKPEEEAPADGNESEEQPFGGRLSKQDADISKFTPDYEDTELFNRAATIAQKVGEAPSFTWMLGLMLSTTEPKEQATGSNNEP